MKKLIYAFLGAVLFLAFSVTLSGQLLWADESVPKASRVICKDTSNELTDAIRHEYQEGWKDSGEDYRVLSVSGPGVGIGRGIAPPELDAGDRQNVDRVTKEYCVTISYHLAVQ